MQNKGKNKGRIILTILSGIAGIALFGYILIMSQSRMTLRSLQDEMNIRRAVDASFSAVHPVSQLTAA